MRYHARVNTYVIPSYRGGYRSLFYNFFGIMHEVNRRLGTWTHSHCLRSMTKGPAAMGNGVGIAAVGNGQKVPSKSLPCALLSGIYFCERKVPLHWVACGLAEDFLLVSHLFQCLSYGHYAFLYLWVTGKSLKLYSYHSSKYFCKDLTHSHPLIWCHNQLNNN